VLDIAGQHIGNRLDAAMRVPRKAGLVIVRPVVAKIIEQENGSNSLVLPKPNARRSFTPRLRSWALN